MKTLRLPARSNGSAPRRRTPATDGRDGCDGQAEANVVLLYDSFAAAVRGKKFCDQLLTELALRCDFDNALWRTDLLEVPAVRAEAARAASRADFIVLALRGDADLSTALETWCGQWMPSARRGNITLIAVFDPATAQRGPMENVRSHLRKAAFANGVHFFSHAVTPGGERKKGARDGAAEIPELPGIRNRLAAHPLPQTAAARRAKTILVVDDYPVLCDVISRRLEEAGYRTLLAHDGEEAQRTLEANAADIELVITDIEMPRMRGDELAIWIGREHATVPVLLMSSSHPRSAGAQSLPLLEKPFRMETLLAAVQEILGLATFV